MAAAQLPLPLDGGGRDEEEQFGPWTVGALTQYIKELLEFDDLLQDVWLRGEVSNFARAASGHLYFTLKDSEAALSCVMWRSAAARLTWQPEQGAAVLAHGRISLYAPRGNYQLLVDELHPAGLGDLHARFEQLKEQLRAEGLFDAGRKRRLPDLPRVIGVVTSPQAAALRDVLNVLQRRYPLVRVLLAPTLVQGDQAPAQIVAALRTLDARDDVDLILLVRGGGSLEELWAFNDEGVARAIAACRHPVVTGVGHETDRGSMGRRLSEARQTLSQAQALLRRFSPRTRLDAQRQYADDLGQRAERAMGHRLALERAALTGLEARLAALSPAATLERGYAIVRRADTGLVVCRVEQVQAGDDLVIRVRDGEFGAVTRSES